MQIDSSFSLIDTAISAIHGQDKRMRIITSGVASTKTTVPDMVGSENDIGAGDETKSHIGRINLDLLPVQMTDLNIVAKAYEANIGVLGRYKQMTETTLDLLG
jgi:flagellar basal body rod protein FlgC